MKTVRADKYCKFVTDGTHDSPKQVNKGRKLITSKHLSRYGIDFESAKNISELDYQKVISRSKVEQWDILFSMIGTIGNLYLERNHTIEYACKNMGIFQMGGDERKAKWLYYYLQTPKARKYIETSGRGTTQSYVPLAALRALPIDVVDDFTRDKIIKILWNIDEKILTNMQVNENLLQQAVAVFNKFYDTSTNLQPFTTLINVLGGGTPKTGNPEFWDGSIPFFTPKDVGTPYTFKTEKYITEAGLNHCNSRLYPQNTTFVTARGTVGKISLAGSPMAMNQSCYALASEIVDPLLVYFYVLKAVTSLKHKASGAVFDAIVTRDFDGEMINILSDTDSESALSIIKPMMEAIHNNSKENMRLSAVRDALLPKLISGEIDVSSLDI